MAIILVLQAHYDGDRVQRVAGCPRPTDTTESAAGRRKTVVPTDLHSKCSD